MCSFWPLFRIYHFQSWKSWIEWFRWIGRIWEWDWNYPWRSNHLIVCIWCTNHLCIPHSSSKQSHSTCTIADRIYIVHVYVYLGCMVTPLYEISDDDDIIIYIFIFFSDTSNGIPFMLLLVFVVTWCIDLIEAHIQ